MLSENISQAESDKNKLQSENISFRVEMNKMRVMLFKLVYKRNINDKTIRRTIRRGIC